MQYADKLDANDVRSFDMGHIVVGGFYRRPDSIAPLIRGVDEDLWFEAVGAFREALRLGERLKVKDDMILVRANLAVAYLIHPAGKQVGEAEKYFAEVFKQLSDPEKAANLDPLVHATVLINSGAGRPLDEARIAEAKAKLRAVAVANPAESTRIETLATALGYSEALALAASPDVKKKASAVELLEKYLTSISPASAWWPIAYQEYVELAKAAGTAAKSQDDFKKPSVQDWRSVTSVDVSDSRVIGLSSLLDDVVTQFGKPDVSTPVVEGTDIKRLRYNDLAISLLGSRDVLAIFLDDEASPNINIRRPRTAGESETISVGMSRKELEALIGDEWEVEFASIDDPDHVYHLYRKLGIAVRFEDNRVDELVVVSVPRKP